MQRKGWVQAQRSETVVANGAVRARVEIRLLHVALGLEADGVAATHENRTDCREKCTAVIATHAIKVSKHVALVAATVREDAHGVLAIVSRISES